MKEQIPNGKEGDKRMCKVISCASQKGGVTKTTTVLNLATALALMGKKVLAVDIAIPLAIAPR
jgi:Mrp family chromosome partitioning ATPase